MTIRLKTNKRIPEKSPSAIKKMRVAGRIVHGILQRCEQICVPGITTKEIDDFAGKLIEESGGQGLFKNYPTYKPGEGFPANLCISVNEQIVHGIAGERKIKDGDIVSLDCGVGINGWCGDSAKTVMVGNVDPQTRKLCEITEKILYLAIKNIKPGRRWSQVARLMQRKAESNGLSVVREFVGHGIGKNMHEEPKVPNFVNRELLNKDDFVLVPGVVLAIEPMCNLGTKDTQTLKDGWTVITKDKKPSAHYEHTVAVTPDGAQVLTDGN